MGFTFRRPWYNGIDEYWNIWGTAMLRVKDIMTKEVTTVTPDTEVAEAAKILLEKRSGLARETLRLLSLLRSGFLK